MGRRLRAGFITLTATGALVAVALHRPGPLVPNPDDPSSAVVGAAGWLAWALVGYVLAGVAISAIGHLRPIDTPDRRRCSRTALIADCLAPRAIRRVVDVAVGTTAAVVVATAAGPVAAYADGGSPPTPRPTAAASLEWPGLAPASQHERVGAPPTDLSNRASTAPASTPAAALVTSPARRRGGPAEDLVVHAGDSLWTLTARRLGPGASAAEVAAAWPRLYAANRAVIGANPALIHPGQRLVPPATEARSQR